MGIIVMIHMCFLMPGLLVILFVQEPQGDFISAWNDFFIHRIFEYDLA